MKKVKTVFVAHPISGNVEENLRKVVAICKEIHTAEVIPIFPSFTWRQYLENGETATQRLADAVNLEYFRRGMVDEIWFYGDRMSEGMVREAILGSRFGIRLMGMTHETRVAGAELRRLGKI